MQRSGGRYTKKSKRTAAKAVKNVQRRERRRSKVTFATDFLPIDQLRDPHDFAERLFAKARKSTDKFEFKLLLLKLISRLIGRHLLQVPAFY